MMEGKKRRKRAESEQYERSVLNRNEGNRRSVLRSVPYWVGKGLWNNTWGDLFQKNKISSSSSEHCVLFPHGQARKRKLLCSIKEDDAWVCSTQPAEMIELSFFSYCVISGRWYTSKRRDSLLRTFFLLRQAREHLANLDWTSWSSIWMGLPLQGGEARRGMKYSSYSEEKKNILDFLHFHAQV